MRFGDDKTAPTWVSDRGRMCHRHTHAGRVTHTHAERDTAHCRPDVRLPVSEPSSATSTVRPCLTRVLGVGASGGLGSLVRSSRTQVLSISLSTILSVSLMPHACTGAPGPAVPGGCRVEPAIRPSSWEPSGRPSVGPGPAGSCGFHPGPQLNQGSSQTVVRSPAPGLPGTFSVTIRDLLDKPQDCPENLVLSALRN